MKEIWKGLIYGGKDYSEWIEISNLGRVRNPKTRTIRKQNLLKTGYYFVSFSMGSREKKKTFRVHKGLAETFIPNPENKPQVNHIDGNKQNNNLENLEWVTNRENVKHAYEVGLTDPTSWNRRRNAKLTDEQVRFIRENYIPRDKKYNSCTLARKFDMHPMTIRQLLNYETYKDVI